MKKIIFLIFVLFCSGLLLYRNKEKPLAPTSMIEEGNIATKSLEPLKNQYPVIDTVEIPKEERHVALPLGTDDVYVKKLNDLPSDASGSKVREALADMALNATDDEKVLAVISQYGIRGYIAESIIVNKNAVKKPEDAKNFLAKLLEEFKAISSTDPEARMSICGSLSNLKEMNISEEVFQSLNSESDPIKRRCLYNVFTANQNFSKDFATKLISKAVSDDDIFIKKVGQIWKEKGAVLSTQEMQPYYTEIMKAMQ
jgi:hypothetical protein